MATILPQSAQQGTEGWSGEDHHHHKQQQQQQHNETGTTDAVWHTKSTELTASTAPSFEGAPPLPANKGLSATPEANKNIADPHAWPSWLESCLDGERLSTYVSNCFRDAFPSSPPEDCDVRLPSIPTTVLCYPNCGSEACTPVSSMTDDFSGPRDQGLEITASSSFVLHHHKTASPDQHRTSHKDATKDALHNFYASASSPNPEDLFRQPQDSSLPRSDANSREDPDASCASSLSSAGKNVDEDDPFVPSRNWFFCFAGFEGAPPKPLLQKATPLRKSKSLGHHPRTPLTAPTLRTRSTITKHSLADSDDDEDVRGPVYLDYSKDEEDVRQLRGCFAQHHNNDDAHTHRSEKSARFNEALNTTIRAAPDPPSSSRNNDGEDDNNDDKASMYPYGHDQDDLDFLREERLDHELADCRSATLEDDDEEEDPLHYTYPDHQSEGASLRPPRRTSDESKARRRRRKRLGKKTRSKIILSQKDLSVLEKHRFDHRVLGTTSADESARPHVLSASLMDALQDYLPYTKRGELFWLQYSMVRDGITLQSLLHKTKGSDYTILAIETMDGEVFGAFTSRPWKVSNHYYGGTTNESFLWRLKQPRARQDDDTTESRSRDELALMESDIEVFPFAGHNHMVQICTAERLAVGGGNPQDSGSVDAASSVASFASSTQDDHHYHSPKPPRPPQRTPATRLQDWGFGLAFGDADLQKGSSEPCITFESPSLSRIHCDGSSFEVANLEIWALTPCLSVRDAERMLLGKSALFERCPTI